MWAGRCWSLSTLKIRTIEQASQIGASGAYNLMEEASHEDPPPSLKEVTRRTGHVRSYISMTFPIRREVIKARCRESPMSDSSNQLSFSQALETAVRTPGAIMEAYSAFHNYSIGNQILALIQCRARGIQSGPIKTFKGWRPTDGSSRKVNARLSCACRSRSNIKGPRQNQAG